MSHLNFDALLQHMTYVLKENELKLGYTDNAVSLNYPPLSLCRILGLSGDEELPSALDRFFSYAEPVLGRIALSLYDGQYCLTVPPEGVRYVHEQVPADAFLSELIELVRAHRAHSIDEVLAVFRRYSDAVVCLKVEGDGYDHVVCFEDGKPDDFIYLFDTAFGDISYHRMTRADYRAELQ